MVSIGLRSEPWGKRSGDTQTLGRPSGRFGSRCSGMAVYGHAGLAIGRAQSRLGGFSALGLRRVAADQSVLSNWMPVYRGCMCVDIVQVAVKKNKVRAKNVFDLNYYIQFIQGILRNTQVASVRCHDSVNKKTNSSREIHDTINKKNHQPNVT